MQKKKKKRKYFVTNCNIIMELLTKQMTNKNIKHVDIQFSVHDTFQQ